MFGTVVALYIGIRKREFKMMKKTVQNSVKRMKNERNRQVAYNMPIVNKDMKKNDEMVRKFFESMKGIIV
jgi:lipid A disaccharide synthetase